MPSQFKGQYEDEEVLLVFKKHPVVMRRGLIYAMIALLLGTVPSLIKPEMSYFYGGLAGGFVLAIIVMFPSWIHWNFSLYIVTDQRFIQITQKGLFNKTVVDLALNQIQMVNYQVAGVQETLLGFGTIMIQTYMGDLVIHEVHHPTEVISCITDVLRSEGIEAEQVDPADIKQDKEYNEEDFEEV